MKNKAVPALRKRALSLPEAEKLAKQHPDSYGVGGNGWVTAKFAPDQSPPAGLIERWILESYRLLVPEKISAQLD